MQRMLIGLLAVTGCGGATSALETDEGGLGGYQQAVTTVVTTVVTTTVYIEREATGGAPAVTSSNDESAGVGGNSMVNSSAASSANSGGVTGWTSTTGGSSTNVIAAGGASLVTATSSAATGGTKSSTSSKASSATSVVANCDKDNLDNSQLCWYKPNPKDTSKCLGVLNLTGSDERYSSEVRMACAEDGNRFCDVNYQGRIIAGDCLATCAACYRASKSDPLSAACLERLASYDLSACAWQPSK